MMGRSPDWGEVTVIRIAMRFALYRVECCETVTP